MSKLRVKYQCILAAHASSKLFLVIAQIVLQEKNSWYIHKYHASKITAYVYLYVFALFFFSKKNLYQRTRQAQKY